MAPLPEYRPSSHTTQVVPTSFSPGKHATQTDDPAIDALPASHVVHSESPACAVYLPATQLPHTLAATWAVCAEYLPGEQLLHCESAVAPWALEYFPLPQFLQPSPTLGKSFSAFCPAWFPYVPAPQAIHAACALACW